MGTESAGGKEKEGAAANREGSLGGAAQAAPRPVYQDSIMRYAAQQPRDETPNYEAVLRPPRALGPMMDRLPEIDAELGKIKATYEKEQGNRSNVERALGKVGLLGLFNAISSSPVNDTIIGAGEDISEIWHSNPIIDPNETNLLRGIVNYAPNIGVNLLKSYPSAAEYGIGFLMNLIPGISKDTQDELSQIALKEALGYLESTIGYGLGPRILFNASNLYKPNVRGGGGGGGNLSAPVRGGGNLSAPVVVTKNPTQAEATRILDLGPGVRNRDVQQLNLPWGDPKTLQRLEDEFHTLGYNRSGPKNINDPSAVFNPALRNIKGESAVRREIANQLDLNMSRRAIFRRAQDMYGGTPDTVFRGTKKNSRLEGYPGQYLTNNQRVARTYGPEQEFLYMRNADKDGLVVNAAGSDWNRIPAKSPVTYKGGFPNRLEDYTGGSPGPFSTDDIYNSVVRGMSDEGRNFNPNSLRIENIIDSKDISLPKYRTSRYMGDNYLTFDGSTLKSPTESLMLPQFKDLSSYYYGGGGVISLLK